jgi:hypothetical protein
MPSSFRSAVRPLLVPVASLALLAAGCGGEEAEPAAPAATAAAASAPAPASASADTPDKVFPQLGASYKEAVAAMDALEAAGANGAAEFAKVMSLESRRQQLVRKAIAMMEAHPEWKDLSKQWYDRTMKAEYASYCTRVESMKGRGDLLASLQEPAMKLLRSSDPKAAGAIERRLANPAVMQQESTEWHKFLSSLGLAREDGSAGW